VAASWHRMILVRALVLLAIVAPGVATRTMI
jgi:hypothetical protein